MRIARVPLGKVLSPICAEGMSETWRIVENSRETGQRQASAAGGCAAAERRRDLGQGCLLRIAHRDTPEPEKATLGSGFRGLVRNLLQPCFERRRVFRGFGVEEGG